MDFRRQALAAGHVEEGGDRVAALRGLPKVRDHGGLELLEADLTAMESVE